MGLIIDVGAAGAANAIETVTTFAALPIPPTEGIGAVRVTADTGVFYVWDGAAWNAVAGGGSIVGGTNVGAGAGVFRNVTANNLTFKSLIAGTHFSITSNANDLTLDVTGGIPSALPVPISEGGTGQSNQQAALNNITNQPGGSNGDVLTNLAGNAQWAAPAATGVTSFNSRMGAVTLTAADVDSALGLGASNAFVFTDPAINLIVYSSWSVDPVTQSSNVNVSIAPNNVGGNTTIHNWNTNVAPLQNSPNDQVTSFDRNINLDSSATGFQFGSNGQAGVIDAAGYNYGGNGATFGILRHINHFSSMGNGTDPGTFLGLYGSAQGFNLGANITIDGQVHGYDWNLNLDVASISTSNFNILWLSDFSQIPVDLYGYQGIACQPNISKIKNNTNFNGFFVNPTITTMEGNAGMIGSQVGGTITTAGVGGFQGYQINTNITTLPATANYLGVSIFSNITTMAATSQFHGVNISPNITTLAGGFNGYEAYPQIAGGTGDVRLYAGGMGSVTTSGTTQVVDLNGQTADGKDSVFSAQGVSMNINGTLIPISNAPGGVQIKHLFFTNYDATGTGAITGTDVLCNVLTPGLNFGNIGDSLALGPDGLGFNMVAFAGQTTGHGQMDLASALTPTAIFASDFTLGEWRNINAYVINAGYAGVTTKATAFYHEVAGAGLFATTHWGLRVVTPNIENYVESMAVGTGSQKVTNASVAIELGGTTRAFVNLNVTTTQKNALTALPGMQVFDTTLNQLSYYNGTVWVNI